MRKLKIEELRVDSFTTTETPAGRRTVHAYDSPHTYNYESCSPGCVWTNFISCQPTTCEETYGITCPATCDPLVCSENFTCPWGYPTCNEDCAG